MNQRGRTCFVILSAVIIITAVVVFTRPAKADPHAMFYTAVGQQQLFFNVLAALDQADYVEPANGASPFSREKILQKRTTAGFAAESNGVVNSTKTDLSSLVTRNVTLEGNDLWSAYLANQFALEASRRDGLAAVLATYCERGLGIKDCKRKNDFDNPEEAQRLKDSAYIVNPYRQDVIRPLERGVLAAANSGKAAGNGEKSDEDTRQNILEQQTDSKSVSKMYPYEYSASIAGLREQIANSNNSDTYSALADTLIAQAARAYVADQVDPYLYDDLTITDNGIALLYEPESVVARNTALAANTLSGPDYISAVVNQLTSSAQSGSRTYQSLGSGLSDYKAEAARMVSPNGTVTNSKLTAPNGTKGPLHVTIQQPVTMKEEQTKIVSSAMANAVIDPKFATADQANQPGDIASANEDYYDYIGTIAGAKDDASNNKTASAGTGHVAGTTTSSLTPDDKLKPIYADADLGLIYNVAIDKNADLFGMVNGIRTGTTALVNQDSFYNAVKAVAKSLGS